MINGQNTEEYIRTEDFAYSQSMTDSPLNISICCTSSKVCSDQNVLSLVLFKLIIQTPAT